jgi:hypothetical protein
VGEAKVRKLAIPLLSYSLQAAQNQLCHNAYFSMNCVLPSPLLPNTRVPAVCVCCISCIPCIRCAICLLRGLIHSVASCLFRSLLKYMCVAIIRWTWPVHGCVCFVPSSHHSSPFWFQQAEVNRHDEQPSFRIFSSLY